MAVMMVVAAVMVVVVAMVVVVVAAAAVAAAAVVAAVSLERARLAERLVAVLLGGPLHESRKQAALVVRPPQRASVLSQELLRALICPDLRLEPLQHAGSQLLVHVPAVEHVDLEPAGGHD